jgi:HAD superfamily hydrolase (TIGR01459 family)
MTIPTILQGATGLLARYDALICDVWGVVHDGRRAYGPAGAVLQAFRARGGHVVLLSNSPMPSQAVVKVLDEKGVDRAVADAIVTSGDITKAHISAAGYRLVHHIGPARDLVLFEGTGLERVALAQAQAIVCTGLIDDAHETAETYRALLTQGTQQGLPFVCANPDLIVDVGGSLLPCAGTLGQFYEQLGGAVYWAGKPYAPAYHQAFETLALLAGGPVDRSRILAIGDALRTDIAGAADAGLDALLIAQGIHRDDLMPDGRITPERLHRVLASVPASHIATLVGAATELAP